MLQLCSHVTQECTCFQPIWSTWFFSCTLLLPLFITMLANSRNLYIAVQFIFAVFFYLAILTFCSFLQGRLCVLHNKRESEYSSLTHLHTRSCCGFLCCQVEGNQVVCYWESFEIVIAIMPRVSRIKFL